MALPTYASTGEKIWHYAYLTICGAIFFFLIAPIVVVIPLSFNAEPYFTFTDKMLSFDPDGYSLRWYDSLLTFGMTNPDAARDASWWSDAWHNAKWISAAKSSIIIGVFSTILATVLGTLAALGLSRPEMPWRRAIMAILISPMIVPIIITATGMFFFYSNPCEILTWFGISIECGKLAGTYLGVILAHATLGIPFVIITVTATLQGYNQNLSRAAASLGASPVLTFFRVTLPLIAPGMISGALFAFATSFDEVVVTLYLAGPDQATLPRVMFSGIRENISPTIAAAATLLILTSVVMLLTLEWLRGRAEKMKAQTA